MWGVYEMNIARDAIRCDAKAIISSLLGLQCLLKQQPADTDFRYLIELQLDALEPIINELEQRKQASDRDEIIALLMSEPAVAGTISR